MYDRPPKVSFHEIEDPDERFAAFMHWLVQHCAELRAKDPAPRPSPEPSVDKPGTLIAAEKELWRAQMCEKLQRALCQDTGKCEDGRCRRARRCRELENIATKLETAQATLAAEQANWRPSPSPPAAPRGRKKGRAGARP